MATTSGKAGKHPNRVEQDNQRKKRPRTIQDGKKKTSSDGVEMLEIPGVPPNICVLFGKSIRSTKTVYRRETSKTILPWQNDDSTEKRNAGRSDHNVLNAVLDRFQEASTEKDNKQQQLRNQMRQAQESFFDALDLINPTEIKGDFRPKSVCSACFGFIWPLQEHARLPVRRAALNLSGQLLLKFEEVRHRWTEDNLMQWLTAVVDGTGIAEQYSNQIHLWQAEAMKWVALLAQSFESTTQFRVAHRFLQQRCPTVMDTASATSSTGLIKQTAASWRRIRDIAMEHSDKESSILNKLMERANSVMDALMPRMGREDGKGRDEAKSLLGETGTIADDDSDDDYDDDGDIDWEEGDEEEDTAGLHLSAVEQTLAVMRSTGALQGGQLEIDLRENPTNEATTNGSSQDDVAAAKMRKLEKVVKLLEEKHLPRLVVWINSLENADGLRLVQDRSLVAMSLEMSRKRSIILSQLLQLQSAVLGMLTKVKEFHKVQPTAKQQDTDLPACDSPGINESRNNARPINSGAGDSASLSPAAHAAPKPAKPRKHSGVIRIKYRDDKK